MMAENIALNSFLLEFQMQNSTVGYDPTIQLLFFLFFFFLKTIETWYSHFWDSIKDWLSIHLNKMHMYV